MIHDVIMWILLWLGVWLGYMVLFRKLHVTYVRRWGILAAYFLLAAVLALGFFRHELLPILQNIPYGSYIDLLLLIILVPSLYAMIRARYRRPNEFIAKNPDMQFVLLDNRQIIPKAVELIFQQLMIAALVVILKDAGFSVMVTSILFGIIFCVVHAPLLFFDGKRMGIYFFIFAILSAFVFPAILLSLASGIIVTYLMHWIFYVGSAWYFWKVHGGSLRPI